MELNQQINKNHEENNKNNEIKDVDEDVDVEEMIFNSRQRAVERIRKKKQEMREKEIKQKEYEKQKDLAPRLQWRLNLKERRRKFIEEQVDRHMFVNAINLLPSNANLSSAFIVDQQHELIPEDHFNNDTSLDNQHDNNTNNTIENMANYTNNMNGHSKNNSLNNSRDHLSSLDKKGEGMNITDISMEDSALELLNDDNNNDLLHNLSKDTDLLSNNNKNISLDSHNSNHDNISKISTDKRLSPPRNRKNKLHGGTATTFRTQSGLGMLAHFINVGGEKTRIGEGLIDSLILVGPNIQHINSLMDYASFKTEDEIESDKIIRNMQPNLLYMTSDNQLEVEVDVLPSFCFPGGIRTDVIIQHVQPPHNNDNKKRHTSPSNDLIRNNDDVYNETKFFVFLLSNHTSSQYCVCMIVPKLFKIGNSDLYVRTFYCMCAITEFPFFTYLYHIMGTFLCMGGLSFDEPIESQDDGFPVQSSLRCVNDLALKLRNYTVPRMGLHLELTITVGSKHYEAACFRSNFNDTDIESNRQILMWALPVLLSYIPLDQIISTIGYTVTEMRLVVCSSDPNILSACLLAIVNLLKPMRWVGPVIVTLPSQLMGYLDSPVPVVLGLQKLPEGFKVTPGMIIINPEERIVHLHHSDLVASHTLTLPQSSKLVKRLKPFVDGILDLTTKWKKRSQSQASSFIWSGETYKKNIVGPAPLMSLDLRPDVEEGKQYISFINAFADEVADHLEAIVSTAIERVNEVDPHGIDLDTTNKKIFSRKDIGDSGMNFIETLRETQMFSQYCFMQLQKNNENELLTTSTLDGDYDELNHGSSGSRKRMDYDPLILLFTILLTGTQPLRPEELGEANKWEVKSPSATSTPNRNRLNSTTRRRDATTITLDHCEKNSSKLFVDENIDWCNGRCNGRVDTPQCTGICLQIWEERIMMVRNQIQVKDMISKGNLLITGNREVLQDVPGAKVIKRHKYETNDQYELRRSGMWCANNKAPRRTSALETVKKYYCKKFQAKREITAQRSLLVLKRFFARTIPRYKADIKRSIKMSKKDRKGRISKNIEELPLHDTRYYDSINNYEQDSSRDAVGNSSRNTRKGVYNLFMHDWIVHSSWSVADNDYHRESIYNKKQANNDEAYTFIRDLVHGSNTFRFESNVESTPIGGESGTDNNNNNNNNINHDELNNSIIQQTSDLFPDNRVDETPQQGAKLFDGLELDVENETDIEDRHEASITAAMTMSPPSSRLMPPLNELGPAAADHLTPQQQSILLELYDNLSKGILVKKHGLSGKPRQRKLFVDSKLSRLLWRPIGINPESSDRNEDFFGRVSLGFTKGDADRELYINDIREVTDDLSTDVMQRSLAKHYIEEAYNARGVIAPGVISIVLADRTVDFEVGMDNWELIYHALKILVNFYQNVLPNYNSRYNSRGSL